MQGLLLALFFILFPSCTVALVVTLTTTSITTFTPSFTSTSAPTTSISPSTAGTSTSLSTVINSTTTSTPNSTLFISSHGPQFLRPDPFSSEPSAEAISPNLVPPPQSRLENQNIKKRECKPNCEIAITRLLFVDSMTQFQLARTRRDPPELMWTLHGCRHGTVDRPSGFNFLPSCQRHDFGVQNYRPGNLWDSRAKRAVDENLRMDLMKECERYDEGDGGNRNGKEGDGEGEGKGEGEGGKKGEGKLTQVDKCRKTAEVYYKMMRKEGQNMAGAVRAGGVRAGGAGLGPGPGGNHKESESEDFWEGVVAHEWELHRDLVGAWRNKNGYKYSPAYGGGPAIPISHQGPWKETPDYV